MTARNAKSSQAGPQHKAQASTNSTSSNMHVVEQEEDEVLDVPDEVLDVPGLCETLSKTNRAEDESIEIPRLEDILADISHAEELEMNDGHSVFGDLGSVNSTEPEFRPEGTQRALAQIINAQADPNLNAKDLLAPKSIPATKCASKSSARPAFVRKEIHVRRPLLAK